MGISLTRPDLFGPLLHEQTCFLSLFLSCPVMFVFSPNPPCPPCTFMVMGKRWSLQSDTHLRSYHPPRGGKQNGMCTKMPANTQKNADSLHKSPPSLDAYNREGVGSLHKHAHRGRPCVITGKEKWSGKQLPVSCKLVKSGWLDRQAWGLRSVFCFVLSSFVSPHILICFAQETYGTVFVWAAGNWHRHPENTCKVLSRSDFKPVCRCV